MHATRPALPVYDVRAAFAAGLVAGLLHFLLQILLVSTVNLGSFWAVTRLVGALVLGRTVLVPPGEFSFSILVVALLVELLLAVLYALPLAALVRRWSGGIAALVGAVYGLGLYLLNYHALTALFPWFTSLRGIWNLLVNVGYGAIAAWLYQEFSLTPSRHRGALGALGPRPA